MFGLGYAGSMGISGHMLGDKKLRKLSRLSGLELDRAYIRNHYAEGRVVENGTCVHYEIDPKTGEHTKVEDVHWTSCPRFD